MPLQIPHGVRTGLLIAAVVGAAAGIDLAVLDLGSTAEVAASPTVGTETPASIVVEVPRPEPTGVGAPPTTAPPSETAGAPAPTAQAAPVFVAAPAASPTPPPAAAPTSAAAPAPTAPRPAEKTTTTTAAPTTTRPTTTTTTRPTTTTTAPAAPATTYRTVSFDGVGDVVVADHGDGTIEFWSCTPAPGWNYQVERNDPTVVKLQFRPSSGGDEAEMEIRLRSDGGLDVKRER